MKIRMEYAAVVALLIAICAMAGAYGLPSGNAPNEVSPLFNVRMDQAMEEMGAGIPGLDPKNDWSYGSINEGSLATSNELTQSADVKAVRAPTSKMTCVATCKMTCVTTCPRTCAATCFTCWRTCGATCGNKQTCRSTCAQTCGKDCHCKNNNRFEVRT